MYRVVRCNKIQITPEKIGIREAIQPQNNEALLTAATKEVAVGSMCSNSPMLNLKHFRRPFQGL
jgi:hypothetical protein